MSPINAIAVSCAFLIGTSMAQQPPTSTPQTTPGAGVVSLVGCVERSPAIQGAPATAPATYKLIEVQPGATTRMGVKPDSQFLLASSTSLASPIDFAKFQNQRVEVTGTLTPATPAKANPQGKPGEVAAEALPTLVLTSLKTVSTECK
jgi:hypothetical protein